MMRVAILLVCVLALSACSETTSDPVQVFENAFATSTPPKDVVPVHGYHMERRKFFVMSEEMWRLHLAGPGAKRFVHQQWPDLQLGMRRVFFQGTQTPWFAPGRNLKYTTYSLPSNPAVTVMESDESDEVFIAFDGM